MFFHVILFLIASQGLIGKQITYPGSNKTRGSKPGWKIEDGQYFFLWDVHVLKSCWRLPADDPPGRGHTPGFAAADSDEDPSGLFHGSPVMPVEPEDLPGAVIQFRRDG